MVEQQAPNGAYPFIVGAGLSVPRSKSILLVEGSEEHAARHRGAGGDLERRHGCRGPGEAGHEGWAEAEQTAERNRNLKFAE